MARNEIQPFLAGTTDATMQRWPGSAASLQRIDDMKRYICIVLGVFLAAASVSAFTQPGNSPAAHGHASRTVMHRYLIKRTFPAGALDGLNLATKEKVNATNAKYHVKWIRSYATSDKNLTFCIYEAPNPQAIRDAAKANGLPVDAVFEVPVTLMPHSADLVKQ